jgi:RimJ/RimL family protein N-acetyltransferase
MSEVQIRPPMVNDLPILMAIDHSCQTEYVWQMDMQHVEGQISTVFREIRLPHSMIVPYPRPVQTLSESWNQRSGILVAVVSGQAVGYIRLNTMTIPRTAWLLDVVVAQIYRRQGIACAMVTAAQSWALQHNSYRVMFEMSSKNYPAIRLAQKLGYEFCGYNDHYYETHDIALFFGKFIR